MNKSKFCKTKEINHNGKNVYLCFEYITKDNINYWQAFILSCSYYIEDLEKQKYNGKIPLREIRSELSGMMSCVDTHIYKLENGNNSTICGVAYITDKIREYPHFHTLNETYEYGGIQKHEKTFGDIITSMTLATKPNSSTTTFCSIFNNPQYLNDKKRGKSSRMLHSFCAKITEQVINNKIFPSVFEKKWSNDFREKKFMVNYPTKRMLKILKKKLSKSSISIGTNEDLKELSSYSYKDVNAIQKNPPRIFKNIEGTYQIIRKNVKMLNLVDKQFIYDSDDIEPNTIPEHVNHGSFSEDLFLTMIKLSALSDLY